MKIDEASEKWRRFIACKIGDANIIGSRVPDSSGFVWFFPLETFIWLTGGRWRMGYKFSRGDSDIHSEGMINDRGFLAVATSVNGSTLIIKNKGDDLGSCKWIAPCYEGWEDTEFDRITTDFLGDPTDVFEEMIKMFNDGIDYYKDLDFEDDYW